MGSPAFAVPCLQSLLDSEHEVVATYCQPPRPAGRGHKLRPTPVQQLAEKHGIPVHYPESLKTEDEQQVFASYHADVAVVAAYGLLLPQAILDAPKRGCINVHPSKLPRWRGAAPLQRTIMAGDDETALCIMQMAAGLDTGDVLYEEPFSITDGMTAGKLHDVMARKAGAAVLHVLRNQPIAIPQSQQGVTYAQKISKQEVQIDWMQPAYSVRQHILGLSPFPAASFEYQGERIKVLDAVLAESIKGAQPGEVLDGVLTIACAEGAVRLVTVQRAGKKPMPAEEMLRGFPVQKGTKLLCSATS